MSREYWLNRWAENRIGFHLDEVNPLLKRFLPLIAGKGAGKDAGSVLVPLCGKSEDLAWLAARGHKVVGVDLSEIAAQAFVSQHGLAVVNTDEPPFKVLRGKNISFYTGDVLDLTAERTGHFDLIYDRAALIALPPDVRPLYAQKLQSFLREGGGGGHILLISLEYDSAQMDGPPFAVLEPEVRKIFSGCQIEKLHEHDCLEEEPKFKERGLTWMKEVVYHLCGR